MRNSLLVEQADPQDEIAALVRTLHLTQQRLEELAGGEVDAVMNPGGQTYLLHDAQIQLRDSEEQFRGTFEQAAVGMAHVSTGGEFLRVNDRLCQITGYSREELTEMTFLDLTMPEDVAEGLRAFRATLAGEQSSYSVEKRYRRKGGEIIWVRLVTALERTATGETKYFISVFVDITQRKQAEENLKASEILLRQFIQHAPAAIAMLDRDMRYIQTSERWIEDYHLSGQALAGQCHYDVFPDAPPRWKDIHQRVLAGAVERCEEDRFERADGSIEWLQWEVRPWHKADGEIGGLIMFTQVVTERKLASEALRLRERALNEVSQGVLICDENRLISYSNANFSRLTGYSESEILHRSCAFLQGPDTDPGTIEKLRAALNAGKAFVGEILNYRKDGQPFWNDLSITPLREHDESLRFIGIQRDITERKQAELSLRESEERFRLASAELTKVLDSSLDAICVFDAEGRFLQVSAACKKIWGYLPEELIGTPYIDKVLPADQPATQRAAAEILAGNSTTSFENRYLRKDGSIAPIMWSAWWSEEEQKMFCVARDRTEARRAEAETRELADRLSLAVKASKVGIWDLDLITETMKWDEQMFALYGVASVSQNGLEVWRQSLHPEDEQRAFAEFEEALRPDGRPFDTSFRVIVPPHGVVRHIRAQGVVSRDSTGRPLRMLGTNWDVTAQVGREVILRQKLENESILLRQALAGEKAKGEFLAVMSHEIRTPMNGVLGFAEMLAQSPTLTPVDRELSQTIVSSGEVLLRILDDILDFSSIEAGKLSLKRQVFSPRELVRNMEELFKHLMQEKGLKFVVSLDPNLPEAVYGDPRRIRQILMNLLSNALKFTEDGAIELQARASMDAQAGGVLEFMVGDTGTGISPAQADAIFEPFTQIDSSNSRRHGGTGLGLTISRRVAELMGGDLRVSSERKSGALFTLRTPFRMEDLGTRPEVEASRPEVQRGVEFALQYPQRILVVEDDRVNRKLIIGVLQKLGFESLSACNGAEAVAIYARENPDCILMDVQMPIMDGIEATRKIRVFESEHSLQPSFISALTANTLPEHEQICLEAGMNTYVNKPIKGGRIADLLVEAWKQRDKMAR